ncbi:MAG: rane protein [Proteobacteria bacterium]|nr:rane protein [Pseudomonadota bacterium]
MNQANFCILLAAIFPILLAGLAKFGGKRLGVDYDNAAPRQSLARLAGWPQRANWAQQNSWEALPVFVAAVLMARQAGLDSDSLALWAWIFILARCAYAACYALDFSTARSLCWVLGFGACIRLMVAAI